MLCNIQMYMTLGEISTTDGKFLVVSKNIEAKGL